MTTGSRPTGRVQLLRFRGRIAGFGTTSGIRVVVGRWEESPLGTFTDLMLELPDGHRVLIAPTRQVADLVATTYTFDEVRVRPLDVDDVPSREGPTWRVHSDDADILLTPGRRTALGQLLRLVPTRVAAAPAWTLVTDPVARVALAGVRTRGSAGAGRREYYGATDVREVRSAHAVIDGRDAGGLAPVDPRPSFGFSSTPRRPAVTSLVTTIAVPESDPT